jgi:uncharacterized membrane protein YphA (DoxX/SURF4 family)
MPADTFTSVIDARALAVTRVLVGVASAIQVVETRGYIAAVLAPDRLTLPYVPGVGLFDAAYLNHFGLLTASLALCLIVGLFTRPAALCLSAVEFYVMLADQQTYSNHLLLLASLALLLGLARSGARYSVDARRGQAADFVPAWPATLIKTQVTVAYLFGGLAKLNTAYLSGALVYQSLRPGVRETILTTGVPMTVFTLLGFSSAFFEIWLAYALWQPRRRKLAVILAVPFHALMILTVAPAAMPLVAFALAMFSAYPLFFARYDSETT